MPGYTGYTEPASVPIPSFPLLLDLNNINLQGDHLDALSQDLGT